MSVRGAIRLDAEGRRNTLCYSALRSLMFGSAFPGGLNLNSTGLRIFSPEGPPEMPTISPSHRLAQKASIAVSAIFDDAGALSERIVNDYGEDLLVQPQLDDEADAFRIFIQVKGTTLQRSKKGYFRIKLDVDHLRRWASQIEPVIVCVWDYRRKKAFAFSPQERFSLWMLATTKSKSLTVHLRGDDVLDSESAKRLIWECRIWHFSRMLSWFENHLWYASAHGQLRRSGRRLVNEKSIVVLTFLKAIGLLRDDSFDSKFRSAISNGSSNLSKHTDLSLRSVFMLALVAHAQDVTGVGLPGNLMENGTELSGLFFRKFHPIEWRRANKRFGTRRWEPYRRAQGHKMEKPG